MDSYDLRKQKVILSITKLWMDENESLRTSMAQIEGLLKDAVHLLNQSKSTKAYPSHPEQNNGGLESIELNNMINNLTRIYQVEDIVSQIIGSINQRTFAIDNLIEELTVNNEEEISKKISHISIISQSLAKTIVQKNLDAGDVEIF